MLRVSTKEQVQGYGLDVQESEGRAYISNQSGWTLSPALIFRDEGVSGALVERPGMLRLEQAALEGLVDVIVVHKFDRIGRTGQAFWTWIWAMEDLGVSFASVTQDIDTTTALGREQLQFHALMAEAEWKGICERTQGGRQRKALEGGWVGGPPPWGYAIEQPGKRGSRLVISDGSYRRSNETRYYRCGGGDNGKGRQTGCSDPYLTADDVEAVVWSEVMTLLPESEQLALVAGAGPKVHPGDIHMQRERVAHFEQALREKEEAAARAAADLARVPDLGQSVKDAAMRQLAEDVRSARELLARGEEVLAAQEEAELEAMSVSGLLSIAGAKPQGLTLSKMGEVIDLLDITVKPVGEVRKRSGVKCRVTEWHAQTGTLVPDEVAKSEWPAIDELMVAYFRRRQFVRGGVDIRTQVNGILHRLRTGCLWDQLPEQYGPWALAKDKQNTWFKKGFWPVLVNYLNLRGGGTPVQRELLVPPLDITAHIAPEPVKRDTPSIL